MRSWSVCMNTNRSKTVEAEAPAECRFCSQNQRNCIVHFHEPCQCITSVWTSMLVADHKLKTELMRQIRPNLLKLRFQLNVGFVCKTKKICIAHVHEPCQCITSVWTSMLVPDHKLKTELMRQICPNPSKLRFQLNVGFVCKTNKKLYHSCTRAVSVYNLRLNFHAGRWS